MVHLNFSFCWKCKQPRKVAGKHQAGHKAWLVLSVKLGGLQIAYASKWHLGKEGWLAGRLQKRPKIYFVF